MRLKKDSSEQKLRGAYYTPLQLADAMVELFASQNISTVLEPSCGDGVFLDALQNLNLLNNFYMKRNGKTMPPFRAMTTGQW